MSKIVEATPENAVLSWSCLFLASLEERMGKGEDVESSGISGSWRRATVGWLARLESFCPFTLPKMQTSKSKQRGIYASGSEGSEGRGRVAGPLHVEATPEEYMDTIEKLMVGMTFSDGNAAISPRCWMKDRVLHGSWWAWSGCDRHVCYCRLAARTVALLCGQFRNRWVYTAGRATCLRPFFISHQYPKLLCMFRARWLCAASRSCLQ